MKTKWFLVPFLTMCLMAGFILVGCDGGDDDGGTSTPAATNAPAPATPAPADADVHGNWNGTLGGSWGDITMGLHIDQDGDAISGNYSSPTYNGPLSGNVDENEVHFQVNMSRPGFPDLVTKFDGGVYDGGDRMGGNWEVIAGSSDHGTWSVTR